MKPCFYCYRKSKRTKKLASHKGNMLFFWRGRKGGSYWRWGRTVFHFGSNGRKTKNSCGRNRRVPLRLKCELFPKKIFFYCLPL
jgi:hypothetical protein